MSEYIKGNPETYDASKIGEITVPTLIATIFSLILFIVAAINFKRVIAETSALEAW